jgi:hypothetical protein
LTVEAALRRAAFACEPDVTERELARASTPRCDWLAAVVLGARGRYAAAATRLQPLLQRCRDPLLTSLACSTLASHRRQLGGHADALLLDGAALRHSARAAGAPDEDGVDPAGARADALLGLAADNLALGRLSAARRLLATVSTTAPDATEAADASGWRTQVRAGWVAAEIALASGAPRDAVLPAKRAGARARDCGARRHAVKSDLVLAAALAAAGDPAERYRATQLVERAFAAAEAAGLRSLVWPAALLAANLDPADADWNQSRVTEELHAVLSATDPVGRHVAYASQWIPTPHLPAGTSHTDIWASARPKKATGSCQVQARGVR